MAACAISGCEKPVYRRDMCGGHYGRLSRYGDPTAGQPMREVRAVSSAIDEFLTKAASASSEECMEWPFATFKSSGYGQVMLGPKRGGGSIRPVGAHAYVCAIAHGQPDDGMEAAHSCGNRLCVNSSHLRWATRKDNHADKWGHGTMPVGEAVGTSRLKERDALGIMGLKGIMGQREIADIYGVCKTTIARIHRGDTWSWLTDQKEEIA